MLPLASLADLAYTAGIVFAIGAAMLLLAVAVGKWLAHSRHALEDRVRPPRAEPMDLRGEYLAYRSRRDDYRRSR